jgi:hypothetical protein
MPFSGVRQGVMGKPCSDRIARQAEDKLGVRVVHDQTHELGIGKVAIATPHDTRVGPMTAQAFDHALEDGRMLYAGWSFARAQGGGNELSRDPLKQEQGQITGMAVIVVIEGKFLLTMGRVLRMIPIQDNDLRRLGVAFDKVINESLS